LIFFPSDFEFVSDFDIRISNFRATMTILRRTLLLWLFMLWQGGFLFYGAVVVTVGADVLGTDFDQGLITRIVTQYLNLIGLIVLLAWIWDLAADRQTRWKRRAAAWLFLVLTLAALAWLHPRMDAHIDVAGQQLLERSAFRHLHRWYLRISTVQWLAAVVFSFWTLQNWRAADRCEKEQNED
jgi:hypothetical protein